MKRFILLTAVVLVASLVFGAYLFSQSAPSAEIASVKGDVKVKLAGKADWVKAKVGMPLKQGDSVKTGKDSEVSISFDPGVNKNIVSLTQETTILLRSLDDKLKVIELPVGKVFSSISGLKRGANFEVRTPSAVAGARGTGWSAQADSKGAEFAAFVADIYVKALDKLGVVIDEEIIQEGFKVLVELFQEIGEMMDLTMDDMDQWNEFKEDIADQLGERIEYHMETIADVTETQEGQEKIQDEVVEDVYDGQEKFDERWEEGQQCCY